MKRLTLVLAAVLCGCAQLCGCNASPNPPDGREVDGSAAATSQATLAGGAIATSLSAHYKSVYTFGRPLQPEQAPTSRSDRLQGGVAAEDGGVR